MSSSSSSFRVLVRAARHVAWCGFIVSFVLGGATTWAVDVYTFSTLPNGVGAAPMFNLPSGAVADSRGYLFVADFGNHAIRQVSPEGVVTTFAGTMTQTGTRDGLGAAARFWGMNVIGIDGADNVYVLDARPGNFSYSTALRKITPRGEVSTIVTSGTEWGVASDRGYWWNAYSMAVDRAGNVYLHDGQKDQINKVSPSGVVTSFFTTNSGYHRLPGAMTVDAAGNVFIANWLSPISRITPAGVMTAVLKPDSMGLDADGMTVDTQGNLFVTDHGQAGVYRVTPDGVVSVFAGGHGNGFPSDGKGRAARFGLTHGICMDRAGNLYVADIQSIRKVTPAGDTTVFVGVANSAGAVDGVGGVYAIYSPIGVAVNAAGDVFVAEFSDCAIRKIARTGEISTIAGHLGSPGTEDGTGDAARFTHLTGIAAGPDGNLYVAEYSCIRRVTTSGVVTTLAGHPTQSGAVDGPAAAARFSDLRAIVVGTDGSIYVADHRNSAIRRLSPQGQVTTFAGKLNDRGMDDGPRGTGRLWAPDALGISSGDTLYLHDLGTIRRIDADGRIDTMAGRPAAYQTIDGRGPAAHLGVVNGLAVDRWGNVVFTELGRVRMMTPDGMVTTIGGAAPGAAGLIGLREGEGFNARFDLPHGITTDARGRLYFTDTGNNNVWRATSALTEARSQLTNISARSLVGTGDQMQIAGFALAGSSVKSVLIRASGPALRDAFALPGALPDPALRLFQGANTIAANTGWGSANNASDLADAVAWLGAFRWTEGSGDSALLLALSPGAYTAQVSSAAGRSGTALVEIYDAGPPGGGGVVNLSARTHVSGGDNVQIAGFVIAGAQPKQVLIRAGGPALQTSFGLAGVLPDPTLTLYQGTVPLRVNTRWGTAINVADIKASTARVGAFAWADGTHDSAILATLEPGAYTAHVSSATQSSGVVLIEIYDVD